MKAIADYLDRVQIRPDAFPTKVILVCFAIVVAFFTSGVPLNWSSLVVVLKGEGIYSDLCPTNGTISTNGTQIVTCAAQDLRLNLVYSVSLLLSYVYVAIQGFILDWRGPRLTFTLGVILYGLGTISFVLTKRGSPIDGVFLGQVLVSMGAPPIFTALMFFASLIPSKMPTITALLNTTFDASVIVYHLFNLLWSNFGITHNSSFSVLMFASFVLLAFAGIWPRGVGHFSSLGDWLRPPKESDDVDKKSTEEIPPPSYRDIVPDSLVLQGDAALVSLDTSTSELLPPATEEAEQQPSAALEHLSFTQQVQTPEFFLFIFFHLTFIVWQLMYMGTVERRAAALSQDPKEVEYYVQVYGWILSSCIVLAPAIGYMVEKIGVSASFAVEHVFAIVWILLMLSNEKSLQIPCYVVFGITRAIYFSLFFLYLFRMWGAKSFGSHLSIMMGGVGMLSLIQYPILKYVEETQNGDWTRPTQWQLVNALVSSIFPVYLILNRKNYKVPV